MMMRIKAVTRLLHSKNDADVHAHNSRIAYDKQEQKELEALGIKVLRHTNADVLQNIEGVLYDIVQTTPHSPPS